MSIAHNKIVSLFCDFFLFFMYYSAHFDRKLCQCPPYGNTARRSSCELLCYCRRYIFIQTHNCFFRTKKRRRIISRRRVRLHMSFCVFFTYKLILFTICLSLIMLYFIYSPYPFRQTSYARQAFQAPRLFHLSGQAQVVRILPCHARKTS